MIAPARRQRSSTSARCSTPRSAYEAPKLSPLPCAVCDCAEPIAEVLRDDRSDEESRRDEPVHCAIDTLVVGHANVVGQVVIADVIEDDTGRHRAAASTRDGVGLKLIGIAASEGESEV